MKRNPDQACTESSAATFQIQATLIEQGSGNGGSYHSRAITLQELDDFRFLASTADLTLQEFLHLAVREYAFICEKCLGHMVDDLRQMTPSERQALTAKAKADFEFADKHGEIEGSIFAARIFPVEPGLN